MTPRLTLAAVLLASAAHAAPPPAGSPAALQLAEYTDAERAWIANQHDRRGRFCCSLGDFDFVELRMQGGQLQARAKHPDKERGIPEGWLSVDEDREVNLSGQHDVPDVVAAWYYNGRIQCIITGSGF